MNAGGKIKAFPFTWTSERRWFLQFFLSILICLNNGACFCFGIFSPFMKQGAFNYSQSDINIVSTVGVILSYFSLPTGYLFDYKGPTITLLVGTVLNLLGWLGMFLIFVNVSNPLFGTNVGVMCLFYGISQFSSSYYETGAVLTNLDSFSCYQGRVILIQKTFMGLGSSVIVQIYLTFFESRFSGIGPFFLFLLCYSLSVGVLGTLFVHLPSEKNRCLGLNVPDKDVIKSGGGESPLFKLPFNVGTIILLTFVFYILIVTLVENFVTLTDAGRIIIGTITILLCLSFSVMIFVTPSYHANVGGYNENLTMKPATTATKIGGGGETNGEKGGGEVGEERVDTGVVVSSNNVMKKPTSPNTAQCCQNPPPIPSSSSNKKTLSPANVVIDVPSLFSSMSKEKGAGVSLISKSHRGHDYSREGSYSQGINLDDEDSPVLEDGREVGAPLEREHVSRGWSSYTGENIVAETEAARQEVKLNSKSLWYNIRRRDIWLMWYVCLASWSSATVVSTNSSQIYESMNFDGYSSSLNVVFVSIYGVASAMGRVIIGFAHPILIRKKIPICSLFCIAPVLNVIGLPLFLAMPSHSLVIPFFIVGLATGVSWGSTILIIKGLFAPNNCGKHYSALYTAGIVSPLIFNIGIFGPVYDYFSKQQGHWDNHRCEGRVCIWVPLISCAIVNAFAIPISIYFLFRVSKRGGMV